jgi:hypothetical protein
MPSVGGFATNTDTSGPGTNPWNNPERVEADDNSDATCNIGAGGGTSDSIQPNTFGFAIPVDATIDGFEVTIKRQMLIDNSGSPRDASVTLVNGAGPGDNKASGATWGIVTGTVVYGGSTDLWGTTWTAADVNDAAFGVDFQTQCDAAAGGRAFSVDYIYVSVWYTEAGVGRKAQVCVTGT